MHGTAVKAVKVRSDSLCKSYGTNGGGRPSDRYALGLDNLFLVSAPPPVRFPLSSTTDKDSTRLYNFYCLCRLDAS